MRIVLQPSRNARLLRATALPGALLVVFAALLATGDAWALTVLPLVLLGACLLRADAAPRAIDLRGASLQIRDRHCGPDAWRAVRVRPGARVGAFAIELPVETSDGRRRRLTLWRDAMSEADYRRLARRVRADRWPAADAVPGHRA